MLRYYGLNQHLFYFINCQLKPYLRKTTTMKKLYPLLFSLSFIFLFQNDISAQKATVDESVKLLTGSLRARDIGPAVMSGRVTCLEGVNSSPETIYIGAASGGVWKSISGGSSFRPVFDEHTMAIGSIAIDQNHPDTVWVGTGESWVRNSVSVGNGIFVSTNGGNSWKFKGLENTERISNVIVDSKNSSTIYAAALGHLWNANEERGVYKSTDFGTTWEKILYINENTGCADLTVHPDNPNIMYAAMWDFRRSPDFFRSGGPGSGLYKTTDGGKNWKKLSNGLPKGDLGRMAVEIAPSKPEVVYLTVESKEKEDKGLYRSDDSGASFKLVNNSFGMTVRPFYFSRVDVDPNDHNKIFKCGLNMTISDDGGETFRTVGSGVHSDIHAVWVNPQNSKNIYLGTDGGGYRSLDGGYLFEMFMDLPLAQFYQISVDDAEPFNVYGGLQDNGSWVGPSNSPGGIENKDWDFTFGGDGFYSFRHPEDENIIYAEYQEGNLVRYDKRDGQTKNIQPIPEEGDPDYRFNWNAPVALSPNNPNRLYFACQYLFMSDDRGDSWKKISPDLTTNDPKLQRQKQSGGLSIDNSGAENNTTIYTVAESPKDQSVIWVGTDDGNLQVTQNGGKKWKNVVENIKGLPKGTWCSRVEPGHFDAGTCYVTFDGHNAGDKKPYLFKTTDYGKSWTSLVTDDIKGYAHTINEDLEQPNLLFLGTEFGLYISIDGGLSWKNFNNNLPKVGVRAMAIHPRDGALVIGTHGRGIYIIDDITYLRQITKEVTEKSFHFFSAKPTILRLPGGFGWFSGAGNFTGENPNDAASIAYYMKKRHTFGKMVVQVYNEAGEFIKELPAGKSAGINIVNLPIRVKAPKAAPTNNRMALFGSVFPPQLPEGKYIVKVKKGKEEFETNINLTAEPDILYPAQDRKLQHKTIMKLYNMTNELGHMYYALEDMHKQATENGKGVPDSKPIDSFAKEVEEYKKTLVSLDGDFYVAEGEEAIREEISTLYFSISQFPGKPSEGQLKKTSSLLKRMEQVQSNFNEFKTKMDGVNELLTAAGKENIKIKTLEEYLKD